MTRIRAIVAVAAVVAVAVAAVLASTATASAAKRQLTVVADDGNAVFAPPDFFEDPEPNGQVSEDAPVYRDGVEVGSAQTLITLTRVTDEDVIAILECSVELPEGNIFFNGSVHFADLATGADFPVVGGTGEYAGFTGVVTAVANEDGSATTLTFKLRKP